MFKQSIVLLLTTLKEWALDRGKQLGDKLANLI